MKLKGELVKIDDEDRPYFVSMHDAVSNANKFVRKLFHAGLWLTQEECREVIAAGRKCLRCYQACAEAAFDRGLTRFKFQPKYHMLGEILYDMEARNAAGHPVINPMCYSTQMDEDLVGRVSVFSRVVSSRTIHERTISRYQVALASKW